MMKRQQTKASLEPLLYISQPSFQPTEVGVQQQFVIKAAKQKAVKDEELPEEKGVQQAASAFIVPEVEEAPELELLESGRIDQGEAKPAAAVENTVAVVPGDSFVEEESPIVQYTEVQEEEKPTAAESSEEIALRKLSVEEEPSIGLSAEVQGEEKLITAPSGWAQKPFRQMSNEEKIHFLLNRPPYVPNPKCRIRVKSGTYAGYIESAEEDCIVFKTQSSVKGMKIRIADILSVHMVSM